MNGNSVKAILTSFLSEKLERNDAYKCQSELYLTLILFPINTVLKVTIRNTFYDKKHTFREEIKHTGM